MADGVILKAEPERVPFPEVTIKNKHEMGMDELRARVWRDFDGKIMEHDGLGAVPPRLACSCQPWCGGSYFFPRPKHLRDLTWTDVQRLLVRTYGRYDYDLWVKEMDTQRKLANMARLAKAQGSSPMYPSFLPVPFIVENALNHDFYRYFSAHNPDKPERFRYLRKALAPLVLDAGLV